MSKLITMKERQGKIIGDVDEHTSLAHIRQECPGFFRKPFGKRETYTMYRGQLIVRNTVKFSTGPAERRTSIYLYLVGVNEDTLCISTGKHMTLKQAKGIIDRVLNAQTYAFEENP